MATREVLLSHIAKAIKAGKTDAEIRELIEQYLGDVDPAKLIAWRNANYKDLRRWAYPTFEEFLEAWATGDAVAIRAIKDKALAVIARFPAP